MRASQTLAEKWDAKYQDTPPNQVVAACWHLRQHLDALPLKGRALDLACGLGGNARLLAQCGLHVDAWDISDTALTHLNNWAAVNHMPIFVTLTDFEQMLFPFEQYDVIVVSRYLNRRLFPQIAHALKPGGKLFYQTFLAPVQNNAPKNPDFYLESGELVMAWPNFRIDIYGEGWIKESEHLQRYSWLLAAKPLGSSVT